MFNVQEILAQVSIFILGPGALACIIYYDILKKL